MLVLVICACAHAPNAIAQTQNPSPMIERTRAHQRVSATPPAQGIRDSVPGPNNKMIPLFIPKSVKHANRIDLVIHFHGAAFVSEHAAAELGHDYVIATVLLGTGSGIYDRSFTPPEVFDSLLNAIRQSVARDLGRDVAFRRIILSGWSAGYGAVRAILRDSAHAEMISAALLLDGLHAGYIPDATPIAAGGQLDTTSFAPFLRYARWAMAGRKHFLITHSEIFPGTFASTTETTTYMIDALGLKRRPVIKWGPVGMQQLSEAASGKFEVRGFAGNSAPDHVDHFHGLARFLKGL